MHDDISDFGKKYAAKRAVILVRVSSKEQEEGYSIEAQKHRLENYCNRRKLSILKVFELVESSTNGDRQHFMEMLKFVKSHHETIAIVADKIDRVQRSFKEYPLLDSLVEKGKIELHFNTENYVIHKNSNSQEKMAWTMGVMMAKSYVDSLRDNVKRSFDQKLRLGEWIAIAPIGYLNARDEKNRGVLLVDPDRAPLVRRLFEEFSKGCCSISELTRKSKEWGLKTRNSNGAFLSKSKVHQILNSPFYYGRMIVKGKEYDHRYPPIIDKFLFDQCQAVFKGWHAKPHRLNTRNYIFRGLITCAVSGRVVTADTKKRTYVNGNTGEWTYLRCVNPNNPEKLMWVREETVVEQVEKILKKITISEQNLNAVINHIRETDKAEQTFVRRQMGELQREHTLIQTRLDSLMDLLLDRVIDRNDFENKNQQLRNKQIDIEVKMAAHHESDDNFKNALITLLQRIAKTHSFFKGSPIEKKRELVNLVFANLSLKGETLCYSYRKPLDKLANANTKGEWLHVVDTLRTDPELRVLLTSSIFKSLTDLLGKEPSCSE